MNDRSVKPISPITIHTISEIETAFRTLQTGKNIGKVVVVPQADDQVKVRSSSHQVSAHADNAP
jgi:hypothetical protein